MKSRAMARTRLFLLLVLAAACGGDPGGPGTSIQIESKSTVPMGAPYTLRATVADSSSTAPWTYSVSWGDGSSSSGTDSDRDISVSHLYATAGSFQATLSVTDGGGKVGTSAVTITTTDPVILAAGDVADCTRAGDDSTAMLLDSLDGVVMPLGDLAYPNGEAESFTNCYGPTWGRHKARTRPVAGNHDYYNPGPDSSVNANGYFGYFGAAAGDPSKGYYSFTLGSWRVIVLNTGTDKPSNYAAGSPQEQWLRAELTSSSQECVLAVFHHPRFSTVINRSPITFYTEAIWNALYEYGADLVLTGHDHSYQRFAPQKTDGTRDDAFGIRQITNGAGGGETLYGFTDPLPAGTNLEVRNNTTHGVLKVTLRSGGYDWKFVPSSGASFTDAGSGNCHGRPS